MAKKKKFTRWWEEDEFVQSPYQNTVNKHKQKYEVDLTQDNEFEYLDEEDQQMSFDSGWDKNLSDKKEDGAKSSFNTGWDDYQKTGVWRGYSYYQKPSLDYKYVQQMANALAAQHRITVEVDNYWRVDLLNKKLTYNPTSLIYGTKSELLATLLHEIGKLRYCEHPSVLQSPFLDKYKISVPDIFAQFENVRVDYLMLKEYESAKEIYESAIPHIEAEIEKFFKFGDYFRENMPKIIKRKFEQIVKDAQNDAFSTGALVYVQQAANAMPNLNPVEALHNYMNQSSGLNELERFFGTKDAKEIVTKIEHLERFYKDNGTIFEFCGEITAKMYNIDLSKIKLSPREAITNFIEQNHGMPRGLGAIQSVSVPRFQNIADKMLLTESSIEIAKRKGSSQELITYLDSDVFPLIEDLLRDFSIENEAIKNLFPNMSEDSIKQLMYEFIGSSEETNKKWHLTERGFENKEDSNIRMNSGPSGNNIPPEWLKGDYKTLKDSVSPEIKSLINKLIFLKREENVVRYHSDQKRGKLDSKKLYKSAVGNRRLFKYKLEGIQVVRSFAFSLLIDVSGSMAGSRIVHTTRGLIILSEVFKKLDIPYEIVAFDNGARVIKSFEQENNKESEGKIGGLVRHNGGGTNLDYGLDELSILKRFEKNKVAIILSDGGVGSTDYYNRQYFTPWEKKGIKSIAVGLECGEGVKQLCNGNSISINVANRLPIEFAKMLKGLILRRR